MPLVGRMGFAGLVSALVRRLGRQRARDGYAVRIDWPHASAGSVCHDFSQFTPSLRRAARRAASARRFWAPGPLRPLAVTVVPINHSTFRLHPRECVSSACPTTALLSSALDGPAAPVRMAAGW